MANSKTLSRRLPVVLLRVWSRNLDTVGDLVDSWRLPDQEVTPLETGLYALLPGAAEAELVESAYMLAQRVFLASPAGSQIRALVLPGQVDVDEKGTRLVPDPLLEDLASNAPSLRDREVYLSGYAIRELEGAWTLADRQKYRGPSGRSCPLFSLGQPRRRPVEWANPDLLGKKPQVIERNLFGRIADLLDENSALVLGALGAGKTRAIQAMLEARRRPYLWLHAWTLRSGGPALAKALASRLLEREDLDPSTRSRLQNTVPGSLVSWWHGESDAQLQQLAEAVGQALGALAEEQPLTIVCDDIHRSRPADVMLLEHLLDHDSLGKRFRVLLLARPGGDPTERWSSLPRLVIGPMLADEAEAMWDQLTDGLSMPDKLRRSFLDICDGFPLVLEDGLLQLARRRLLRQLYGNFFYSGAEDVEFQSTVGLVRKLEAEVGRLGAMTQMQVLAAADSPVPASILSQAAREYGAVPEVGWEGVCLDSGLLREEDSAWGLALRFSCSAHAQALRASLQDDSLADVRRSIAELLEGESTKKGGAWQRYELLAGSTEAVPALLEAAHDAEADQDSHELFEAVRQELEHHRDREGDEKTELELLWILLPLARRLGNLRSLGTAIDRAIQLAAEDPKKRLALISLRAEHAQDAGNLKEAERFLLEGLELAKGASPARQSLLLIQLGKLLARQDRLAEARKLFEDFLPNVDSQGSPALAATCRYHLGNIALHEHRLERALELHRQALRTRQEHQLNHHLGSSLTAMGRVTLALGNYPRALKLFRESEEVLEEFGAPGEASFALVGIGRALSRLGDYVGASPPLRRGLELREGLDDQTGEAIARLALSENQLRLGNVESAEQETRKAHFRLMLIGAARYVGDAERILGEIELKQRQYEAAAEHFLNALEQHRSCGHLLASTFDRAWLLESALALENREEIERYCGELERVMKTIAYPELGEQLDLRLYRGLRWLASRGDRRSDPLVPLERAYEELCRKTELLDPELRNRFLFQIPDNRAIVDAATMHGLTTRSLADTS